jgi:hypothetical protein
MYSLLKKANELFLSIDTCTQKVYFTEL